LFPSFLRRFPIAFSQLLFFFVLFSFFLLERTLFPPASALLLRANTVPVEHTMPRYYNSPKTDGNDCSLSLTIIHLPPSHIALPILSSLRLHNGICKKNYIPSPFFSHSSCAPLPHGFRQRIGQGTICTRVKLSPYLSGRLFCTSTVASDSKPVCVLLTCFRNRFNRTHARSTPYSTVPVRP